MAPLNPGATCFLDYAVAFLHRVERVGHAFVWLPDDDSDGRHLDLGAGAPPGRHPDSHGDRRRRGKNLALQRSRDESARLARIAERERIRRDLHDLLRHTLSVIVLKSELAAKVAESDPQRSVEEVRDVEHISRNALTDVRATVTGYRAQGMSGELDNACWSGPGSQCHPRWIRST